jgi:hypothetical protein
MQWGKRVSLLQSLYFANFCDHDIRILQITSVVQSKLYYIRITLHNKFSHSTSACEKRYELKTLFISCTKSCFPAIDTSLPIKVNYFFLPFLV